MIQVEHLSVHLFAVDVVDGNMLADAANQAGVGDSRADAAGADDGDFAGSIGHAAMRYHGPPAMSIGWGRSVAGRCRRRDHDWEGLEALVYSVIQQIDREPELFLVVKSFASSCLRVLFAAGRLQGAGYFGF
jgi:hypothetical protein